MELKSKEMLMAILVFEKAIELKGGISNHFKEMKLGSREKNAYWNIRTEALLKKDISKDLASDISSLLENYDTITLAQRFALLHVVEKLLEKVNPRLWQELQRRKGEGR